MDRSAANILSTMASRRVFLSALFPFLLDALSLSSTTHCSPSSTTRSSQRPLSLLSAFQQDPALEAQLFPAAKLLRRLEQEYITLKGYYATFEPPTAEGSSNEADGFGGDGISFPIEKFPFRHGSGIWYFAETVSSAVRLAAWRREREEKWEAKTSPRPETLPAGCCCGTSSGCGAAIRRACTSLFKTSCSVFSRKKSPSPWVYEVEVRVPRGGVLDGRRDEELRGMNLKSSSAVLTPARKGRGDKLPHANVVAEDKLMLSQKDTDALFESLPVAPLLMQLGSVSVVVPFDVLFARNGGFFAMRPHQNAKLQRVKDITKTCTRSTCCSAYRSEVCPDFTDANSATMEADQVLNDVLALVSLSQEVRGPLPLTSSRPRVRRRASELPGVGARSRASGSGSMLRQERALVSSTTASAEGPGGRPLIEGTHGNVLLAAQEMVSGEAEAAPVKTLNRPVGAVSGPQGRVRFTLPDGEVVPGRYALEMSPPAEQVNQAEVVNPKNSGPEEVAAEPGEEPVSRAGEHWLLD